MNRQILTQGCWVRDREIGYELSVSIGLLGAAGTVNENFMKREDNFEKITLPMFVQQIESAISQLAKVLDPTENDEVLMRELAPDLVGHSMGGYLATMIAKSPKGYWKERKMLNAIRSGDGAVIVADKPAIVGPKYRGLEPAWMTKVLKSELITEQVKLLDGWRGWLVEFGLRDGWENFEMIREVLGPYLAVPLFADFIDPSQIWDGENIEIAHRYNYFWDRLYHKLCAKLLSEAPPVMSFATMIMQKSQLSDYLIVMGRRDKVLAHDLAMAMADGLDMQGDNVYWGDGVHHASLKEIIWMMRLGNVRNDLHE